ncbi:hypothetical protein GCM10018791_54300 [Streptomyces zaomyceticus]|nr:hypothetical protein GCM10018791_54300 [Streptomyces zaomyceticus]
MHAVLVVGRLDGLDGLGGDLVRLGGRHRVLPLSIKGVYTPRGYMVPIPADPNGGPCCSLCLMGDTERRRLAVAG